MCGDGRGVICARCGTDLPEKRTSFHNKAHIGASFTLHRNILGANGTKVEHQRISPFWLCPDCFKVFSKWLRMYRRK